MLMQVRKSICVAGAYLLTRELHTDTPPARYVAGQMPSQNPGDPHFLSTAKQWVQDCDRMHEKCAMLSTKRPLPTRILDLEGKPIVCITNRVSGRYVVLSYCRETSGKNVLLTKKKDLWDTKSTFDKFTSDGVELNTLPKPIQDAITVCRVLGIKYLWVDALCIIQEERDLADFKVEAPRMPEYYRNAYLTLIAGSARDCADGFLNGRAKLQSSPCESEYNRTTVSLDASDIDSTGTVRLSLPSDDAFGHILTCASTYQEMFLSQRYLNYGPSQMSFRCDSHVSYEDGNFRSVAPPDRSWAAPRVIQPSLYAVMKHSNKAEAVKYRDLSGAFRRSGVCEIGLDLFVSDYEIQGF